MIRIHRLLRVAARPAGTALALACCLLSGCATPVGPVEVTRFHLPDASQLGRGPIAIEPGEGMDSASLEYRSYAVAVTRQLALLGYSEAAAGTASPQVAVLRIERRTLMADTRRNPVSVGVGGSTGSYGSGIGVGIGIDLSGPPPDRIETELSVMIRDRASGQSLWEGRASFTTTSKSPLAETQLAAAKMAEALFKGFPGTSGETIQVP